MNKKLLFCVSFCLALAAPLLAAPWWNAAWHYRAPLTVDSGMYDRADYLVRQPLDLKKIAQATGLNGTIDVNSLRLIEFEEPGAKMTETPFYFKPDRRSAAVAGGQGMLYWIMRGSTPSMTERTYFLYFDAAGRETKQAPLYNPLPGTNDMLGENILPNNGFEQVENGQPVGWSQIGISSNTVGTGQVTDKEAHSGQYSLYISKPKPEGESYRYGLGGWESKVLVVPRRRYMLSGWIKAAGKGTQCIQMTFYDEKYQVPPGSKHYVFAQAQGAHDWGKYTGVLDAPPGSYYVGVGIHLYESRGEAWFDDLSIVEAPAEEPPAVKLGKTESSSPSGLGGDKGKSKWRELWRKIFSRLGN